MKRTILVLPAWVYVSLLLIGGCSDRTTTDVSAQSSATRLDALFDRYSQGVQPGVAVAVMRGNEVVYEKTFGYAQIESKTPLTPESAFRLASVSKQMTAVGILTLVERGRVSLEDPMVKYLPGLFPYPDVTVRQLLNHTSGLPDYYDVIVGEGRLITNQEAADYVTELNRLEFKPGEKYEYSNSAYELAALVAEHVSGQDFATFMEQAVFQPAGMNSAMVFDHTNPQVSNRVYGYDSQGDAFELNDYHDLNGIVGSGGVYGSLRDLEAWCRSVLQSSVISKALLTEAHTPSVLNDGNTIDYGLGWGVSEYRGQREISHTGSWVGFRTAMSFFPEQQLFVVVLSNRSDFESEKASHQIADIFWEQE